VTDPIANPLIKQPKATGNFKGFAVRAAVIFLAAMFVYIPAMQSKWIWDDNLLITQFPPMQHKDGLRVFWFSSLLSKQLEWMEKHAPWLVERLPWIKQDAELADMVPDYYPITWSTLWLEWKVWGDNPYAFHVTNCLMHALAAVLVWRVLAGLSIPAAFLAGLVFAVHPVNVCSVAWISECKNTLVILFFLLTLLFYFKFDQRRRWFWYVLALVMFVFALLSKASVVTLPVVLFLAAWWRREGGQTSAPGFLDRLVGTWRWGSDGQPQVNPAAGKWRYFLADLVRTMPFFLLAAGASWLIVNFQIHHVIRGEEIYKPGEGTIGWRLAMAGAVPWFYLYKDLWPFELLMIYRRWNIDAGSLRWYLPGVALVVSAVVLLCLHRRSWARNLIFALGYFLVMLFPTLGFFDMYFFVHSLVADHWQYLSIIGVIALVIGTGGWFFQRQRRAVRWVGIAAGVVVVGGLAVLTWNQTLVYEDQIALWRYNLPKNGDAWMGQYNLGTTLAESVIEERDSPNRRAVLEESLVHFLRATELRPTDTAAQNNTGMTLLSLNRPEEALPYFHRAIELGGKQGNLQAATNLCLAYQTKGDIPEALKWVEKAGQMTPYPRPELYMIHADILMMAKREEDAVAKLTEALRIEPRFVEAWYRRGLIYKSLGKVDQAQADFQQTVRLQANAAPALVQLAQIAQEQGRIDEAIHLCTQAILVQPGYTEARYRLGLLLMAAGRNAQAATHLSLVVQADPSNFEAHGNLALALRRLGQIAPAIAEYRKVLELKPGWVAPMCDLAMILAHPGSGPHRDLVGAFELADKACRMTQYGDPRVVETLAMVYAEAGRFDQAVKFQQQAMDLLKGQVDEKGLNILKRRIELYKSHQPRSTVEPLY
jgi:tetratricopeptide (TPR) repeat protein